MSNPLKKCGSDPRLLAKCADPNLLLGCGDIGGLLWANINTTALTHCEAEAFPCNGFWQGSMALLAMGIPYNPADPVSLTRRIVTGGSILGQYGPHRYIDDLFCNDGNDNPPICPRDPVENLWALCQGGLGTSAGDPCALRASQQYNFAPAPICMRQIGLFNGTTEIGVRLSARVGLYRYRTWNEFGFDPSSVATYVSSACCTPFIDGGCVEQAIDTTYAIMHGYKPFFHEAAPVPFGTECARRDLYPRIGTLLVDIDIRSPEIRVPYNRAKHELVLQHPEWVETDVRLSWQSSSVSGVVNAMGGPHVHLTTSLIPMDIGVIGVTRSDEFQGWGRIDFLRDISGTCPSWGDENANPPCGCYDNGPSDEVPQTTQVTIPDYNVIRLDFRSVD